MIVAAHAKTQSNLAAARYLHVSYQHYRKFAKIYVDEVTGKSLFELHKNQCGKGIPKFLKHTKKEVKTLLENVLNGAVLVRGHDYTATNGTSITGLSPALVANDVLEVFSFIAFSVANTYTQSQVDGLIAGAISLAIFNETQSSGTEGGANTNGSYTKRTLNTTIVNTITGCSIASSVITLPAGTYHVTASAPALAVNGHRIRFRNTSDSTTAVLGATGYTATSAPNNDRAILDGYFIITGSKNFELQHMTATLKTGNGLGAAQSQDALGEVYSVVTIRKIA